MLSPFRFPARWRALPLPLILISGLHAQQPAPEVLSDSRNSAAAPAASAAGWAAIRAAYQTPDWFRDGKFGIFMHWGIYSVPAHQSEWYVRYMYGGNAGVMRWHTEHYGSPTTFGYKDFIPMFTAAKWNPAAWAELFRRAGAKYVIPTAEHHDGFSLWDSAYNRFNAKNMGPRRDLIGDLGAAVRQAGLKFGVSNHSANHFTFIPPLAGSDEYDPNWADFYSVADRSPAARSRFNDLWVKKNLELIDKYRPDMLWFDGIGAGISDGMKLAVARHYFARAQAWGKQVALSGKYEDFPAGAVRDYERQGRIEPRGIKPFAWQVDDPMGNKFAYVTEIQYKSAALLIHRLIDCVSMNGNYLMNISPMADGTIPAAQQERLLGMGRWLDVNGEAIYGSRPWARYGEGPYYDSPPAKFVRPGPDDPPNESYTSKEVRFTTKNGALYAVVMDWPGDQAIITSLGTASPDLPAGKIERVNLLGHPGDLEFTQDAEGLKISLPPARPCDIAYTFKISGLKVE